MKNADMPAMPCDEFSFINDAGYRETIRGHEGMTKREMMAMHIASGFAADGQITIDNVAKWSVEVADKLLQELDRTAK